MILPDSAYMSLAIDLTKASLDESRKTACVFVDALGNIRASGVNAFPAGVARTAERAARPAKYIFTEHAERNAICAAAKAGRPLNGCTAFVPWFPCADCARVLVQVGTRRLVCFMPDWDDLRYNFREAREILEEGGVQLTFAPGSIGDGK